MKSLLIIVPAIFTIFFHSSASAGQTSNLEVYMFRGLGEVFSNGLKTMEKKIIKKIKDEDLDVQIVFKNHTWMKRKSVMKKIIKRHENGDLNAELILIGHSLGANAIAASAKMLQASDIKVSYMAFLDVPDNNFVSANVERVDNFMSTWRLAKKLEFQEGFSGEVEEFSFPKTHHLRLDNNKEIHARIIEQVLAL